MNEQQMLVAITAIVCSLIFMIYLMYASMKMDKMRLEHKKYETDSDTYLTWKQTTIPGCRIKRKLTKKLYSGDGIEYEKTN